MGGTNKKLTTAVETYLDDLRRIRASGGATGERSSYGPLANLLNAVGTTLKPKVFCVGELADQGAGHPDFGLYTAKQVQRGRPREGQAPERGVVEVKSPHEDLRAPAVREQVVRYWGRYRLVLVTNLREFDLVGPDPDGGEAMLESFRLAESEEAFARRLEHPRAPVLRALFQQLFDPGRLQPLGLVEVLDWTAAALDRVDREAFFSRFNEGEAVPYFYEPFLEAFDPELRKQLGVWYTPAEVVRYMVARVDRALKDDLDIPDGLAAENVYVLDPVLRHRGLSGRGAAPHRRQPRRARRRGARGGADSPSSDGARVRLRDHARALRRRPSAGRLDHAGSGCAAGRRRRRARRHLPHQCADRLGAADDQASSLPGARGGARPRGAGEAGNAGSRHPRQSAL